MKFLDLVRNVLILCVLYCLYNLLPRSTTVLVEVDEPTLCDSGLKVIGSHELTVRHWQSKFSRHYSRSLATFGYYYNSIESCQIRIIDKVHQFAYHNGVVSTTSFRDWNYTYQYINGVVWFEPTESKLQVLTFGNVYQHIDFVLAIGNSLKQRYHNEDIIVVWLMPDFISGGVLPYELKYLFHSLVLHHVVGKGIFVIPKSNFKSQITLLCKQLSSLLYTIDSTHVTFAYKNPTTTSEALRTISTFIRNTTTHTSCDTLHGAETLQSVCEIHKNTRKLDARCMPSLDKHLQVAKPTTISRSIFLRHHDTKKDKGVYSLLVTGLGGSSTHSLANLLTDVGIQAAHEGIDTYGSVSWLYAVNDWTLGTTYPWGTLDRQLQKVSFLSPRYEHVIHCVRHPLKQISSVTSHANSTFDFILTFIKKTQTDPVVVNKFMKARALQLNCFRGESCHLYFAALSWVYWNRHVRSYADATYRIEQPGDFFHAVCTLKYSDAKKLANCKKKAERRWKKGTYDHKYAGSLNHKMHLQYSLEDIRNIDPELSQLIVQDAHLYGYTDI